MKAFIQKQDYNFIKKCLFDLNSTLINCTDPNIVEANRSYINDKILALFDNLSDYEKVLLDTNKLNDPIEIPGYLSNLEDYVYGMSEVTKSQLLKLFKKEKKLKLPTADLQSSKHVYLGWLDESNGKLFVAYNMDGKLVGMVCRLQNYKTNTTHMCALCNHIGKEDELVSVSSQCKTSNSGPDAYKSTSFYMCLDSEQCNNRIVSALKLEGILKEVNNL